MKQADAVAARIDLDLRIGAAFSRLTTLGLQQRIPELNGQVISYGRLYHLSLVWRSWFKDLASFRRLDSW